MRFKVLDFKTLEKTRDNPRAMVTLEERYSNPFYLSREIVCYEYEHLDRDGNLLPGGILPFAKDIDASGCWYFGFKPNDSAVYFENCATDGVTIEELLANNVEDLIGPIDDIIHAMTQEGKVSIHIDRSLEILRKLPSVEQFVEEKNTFMYDGKSIGTANDYKLIIEYLIGITDGMLDPDSLTFEVVKDTDMREITVAINGVTGNFVLKQDRWIDSNLLPQLNELFGPVMEDKRFIEVYDRYRD